MAFDRAPAPEDNFAEEQLKHIYNLAKEHIKHLIKLCEKETNTFDKLCERETHKYIAPAAGMVAVHMYRHVAALNNAILLQVL